MNDYLLQTVCLTKTYGGRRAVDSLSLHVPKGAIYGLIGRNGAGKTTFMKMIAGLAKPTSGEIRVFGKEADNAAWSRSRIGALIEAPGIYTDMTAFDNMRLKAIATGVYSRAKIEELLALVGLSDTGSKKTGQFSLGMKQRLGIALSLIGTPDLLILDEPINGLDPQGIIEIRGVIERLAQEYEMTVIISSHILDELARIATHYGIINEGRLVRELSKEELLNQCAECVEIKSDAVKEVCLALEEMGYRDYEVCDGETVRVANGCDNVGQINLELARRGILLRGISVKQESLEDFFCQSDRGSR